MERLALRSLEAALRRLAESDFVPQGGRSMEGAADRINKELRDTVLGEIPAFTETGNPDILPELAQHAARHTDEILRLLRGGVVGEFTFVREHAERRAEQRFPLESMLHAYRCGHKVFSRHMRDAALGMDSPSRDTQQTIAAIADFAIEYTDAVSTIVAGAYVARTRLLAEVAGDQRAELLSILLDGYDESDGRVAGILRDAGYLDSRRSFCVALAQPVDPSEMRHPARARRLAESVDRALQGTTLTRLIDVREDVVTAVLSYARRLSGWTAPRKSLADQVMPRLETVGPAALIGVSNDVPSTSHVPTAYREARVALDLADVGHRVVQISEISARRLLLHLAGKKLQRVLPPWTCAFVDADNNARGVLVATLKAYADADMNVLQAAQSLRVHPNTIYSRFQKVREVSGLDPRSFHDLTELLIVADSGR